MFMLFFLFLEIKKLRLKTTTSFNQFSKKMFIYEIYKKDINLLLELAGDFKILIQRNFPQTKHSKKKS